jgi:hypothetical protein
MCWLIVVFSRAGYSIPQSYSKHTARLLTQLFPEPVKIMPTLRQILCKLWQI